MNVEVRFIANEGAMPKEARDILVYLPKTFLSCFQLYFDSVPSLLGEKLNVYWGSECEEGELQTPDKYRVRIFTAESRDEEERRITDILNDVRKALKWLFDKNVRKTFDVSITVTSEDEI